jgi:GT2 family glycosyltransferase
MNIEWPTVSVVIVSWNARHFLEECLRSLRAAGYPGGLQVIVIDNASTDGSQDVVETDFPEAELVRNAENLGFAKASNMGIRLCKADYVALVNSDVRVQAHCITTLVTYLRSTPTAGLVGPSVVGGDGRQQTSFRTAPTLWSTLCRALALDAILARSTACRREALTTPLPASPVPVQVLSGCFWLTHQRALDTVGLLDERFFIYAEDMDWCKRFWNAGWQVVFVPQAGAVHYGGASSANAPTRFFVEKQKADLQYWRKHHSPAGVMGYRMIALLHHLLRTLGYAAKSLATSGPYATSRYKARRSAACIRWLIGL